MSPGGRYLRLSIIAVMAMRPEAREQIEDIYRRLAEEGRYRPAAPSDGMGGVLVPEEELDLDAEAAEYAERWRAEEDSGDYHIGSCSKQDRPAFIFAIEAARLIAGGGSSGHAARLLRMAADELDGE
jgi:hypothetical protein